ncbi:hypothetical protein M514_14775 [Trichuris suis]|uniref:Reverse transcriptase domain-containing protein n=1 Tax=Trichuris suis TaxID=68888 RepID=A0A085NTS5_9BILA|nr:hypothetical protein M514_14775 [Trichuris suis]
MLRDRLMCGVHDEGLQRRLLAEPSLTLKKAQEMALAYESAQIGIKELRCSEPPVEVGLVSTSCGRRSGTYRSREAHGDQIKFCYRCKGCHAQWNCQFKNVDCRFCRKKGHIERACRLKASNNDSAKQLASVSHSVVAKTFDKQKGINIVAPRQVDMLATRKLQEDNCTTVWLNDVACKVEVDSGSAFSPLKLEPVHMILRDYQQRNVPILGRCVMKVRFGTFHGPLEVLLVKGKRPDLEEVTDKFADVFSEGLGKFKGPVVSVELDPCVRPICLKARNVPFALRQGVEAELNRLIIREADGGIRICSDYKSTLNRALRPNKYPVPSVEQLFSTLAGGKVFAKLDLAQAYHQQLVVDNASADAQTLITHKGFFHAKRLQFGVSTAPGIFQSFIDARLAGIPGVLPYFDYVLVIGSSEEELTTRVREVLRRFSDDGLRVHHDKCVFHTKKVEFLGYLIDEKGLHPTVEKIKCIQEWQNNCTDCLDKECRWNWTKCHEIAFQASKQLLSSDSLLVHYDEQKPLTLTCDASPYGVGAVLSHKYPGNTECPVRFYSRTLTATERNYAQIDKEALAIIAAVRKFHDYIYGRHVEIRTDRKPLLGLLAHNRATPQMVSPRLLRWSILLNMYDYELVHYAGKSIANADALSRLPASCPEFPIPSPGDVLMLEAMQDPPLTADDISRMTAKDPVLSRVLMWVLKGWPNHEVTEEPFKPFLCRKSELSTHKHCLLWGNQVVVPKEGRPHVLEALHSAHPGIV